MHCATALPLATFCDMMRVRSWRRVRGGEANSSDGASGEHRASAAARDPRVAMCTARTSISMQSSSNSHFELLVALVRHLVVVLALARSCVRANGGSLTLAAPMSDAFGYTADTVDYLWTGGTGAFLHTPCACVCLRCTLTL